MHDLDDDLDAETITLTDAQTRCLRRIHKLAAQGTPTLAPGDKDAPAGTLRALARFGLVQIVKRSKGALYEPTSLGVDLIDALFG